jgi:hypothetical protein
MQVSHLDFQQLADVLVQSEVLATLDGPGSMTTHVLRFENQDILVHVAAGDSWATVVYPCSSFDHEQGSIHDNARESLGLAHDGAR